MLQIILLCVLCALTLTSLIILIVKSTKKTTGNQNLDIVITETKDYESLVELKKKCRKRNTNRFNYKYNDNMVIFYKEPLTTRNKKKCNLCLNENNNYNQKNWKNKTNTESNSNIRYYEGEDGCASCGCSLQ